MIKICFVSLDSYPLLTETNMGSAGGAEVQQVILAKELLNCGYVANFIVYNYGSNVRFEIIKNIFIIKSYNKINNINILFKIYLLWKAMATANADIYYHHSGANGIVALFAYLTKKKFIYHIASDGILCKSKVKNFNTFYKLTAKIDILLADIIIAQNEIQKEILEERFNRQSVIIKNSFPVTNNKEVQKSNPPIVLWVGTISEIKQPHLFLHLAKLMPNTRFQMIGGIGNDIALYENIKQNAAILPNFEFVGFVPFHKISKYFERSSLFVNTSKFEGFPNTFIQAWMNQVPVISLNVDPSEVICRNKLGFHVQNIGEMREKIDELLQNDEMRMEIGKRAQNYANLEHNIKSNVKKYIDIFNNFDKK